jgi:hypothetical protein
MSVSFRTPLAFLFHRWTSYLSCMNPGLWSCFTFCNGCLNRMVRTICSNVVKTNYLLLLHLSGYVVSFYSPSGSGGNSQVVVMLVKLHHCLWRISPWKLWCVLVCNFVSLGVCWGRQNKLCLVKYRSLFLIYWSLRMFSWSSCHLEYLLLRTP